MSLATLTDQGCFTKADMDAVNNNFALVPLLAAASNAFTGNVSVAGTLSWAPSFQACAGAADVVLFADALNVAIFTSTGPDDATLAVPGAADVGKILILVNTNTTQNVVTTTANKIVTGGTTPGDTLTAPAHNGAVAVLIASNGFWNLVVGGTGSWVLSEV